MMRVLITGGTDGQLVSTFLDRAARRSDIDPVALGPPQLDLADVDSIAAAIAAHRPDLVVNAAAYTAVDKAEDEPDLAFAVNATGAGAVAAAAADLGVPIVQISTDYVFDGQANHPYREGDAVNPLGVYGRSKLAGERLAAAANPRHVIVRTAWVFSHHGHNFLKTMLRLAESRDEIDVVADQIGNPTSTRTIADGILTIADRLGGDPEFGDWGVYHLTGDGETSWAGFAAEIFRCSRARGGPSAGVRPISTADYPTKARRPANSRLDSARFSAVFGYTPSGWQEEVSAALDLLQPSGAR